MARSFILRANSFLWHKMQLDVTQLGPFYWQIFINMIRTWIRTNSGGFMRDVITHVCYNFTLKQIIGESLPSPPPPPAVNTLRPRQNGRHLADDIFKCIFLNENAWISLKISLKFVPKVQINNIPALVQLMAWRRPGDKPLSETMMVSLLTHICVTRPQWVNVVVITYPCPNIDVFSSSLLAKGATNYVLCSYSLCYNVAIRHWVNQGFYHTGQL